MIEIILIFLQIIFIGLLIFFSVPNISIPSKYCSTLTEVMTIKSIIILNIFLLFSFFNINMIYLLIVLIFSTIFLLIYKKNQLSLTLNLKYFFIFLYIVMLSIVMANQIELGWDAKFFWFLKTINFYQNNNLINLDQLPASDYPHLGSYIWSFFWKFPFNAYEYLGRIFYIFIYIISIFYFCEIFKISDLYKITLSSLIIITSYSKELFSGNQEILIFSLILIAAKLSYEIISAQTKYKMTHIIFLLFSFNAAIWIKNEGIFLVGFILLLILILGNLTFKQKKILVIGSIFFIILRILIFKFLDTGFESFEFEKTFDNSFFKNLVLNLKIISFYSIVYTLSLPLILLGLILLLYNLYTFKIDQTQIFIICYTILNIIFILGAFLFSVENVEWQVRVGLKRVMFETSGFYLLTIAYLFNKTQVK
jgi:hypothetical protein